MTVEAMRDVDPDNDIIVLTKNLIIASIVLVAGKLSYLLLSIAIPRFFMMDGSIPMAECLMILCYIICVPKRTRMP